MNDKASLSPKMLAELRKKAADPKHNPRWWWGLTKEEIERVLRRHDPERN